jgi:hypothetical protein
MSGSASVGTTNPSPITEKESLDIYLAKWSPAAPTTSFLEAAVRDAQTAIKADPPAMWLGTLAYLAAVEQMGHAICRRTNPRSLQGSRAGFLAACKDFGDSSLSDANRGILYDVRCALAHQYGLTGNAKKFEYTDDVSAALISRRNLVTAGAEARIALPALWTFVDDMVDLARTLHASGDVAILSDMTPNQVKALSFSIYR